MTFSVNCLNISLCSLNHGESLTEGGSFRELTAVLLSSFYSILLNPFKQYDGLEMFGVGNTMLPLSLVKAQMLYKLNTNLFTSQ